MKSQARIVIIGGGVVGCSIAYHLAKFGCGDVVLCERTELTAGSTWHAAGLLPLFNMDYSMGQIHKYSVDLYQSLEAETGQPVGFHKTGNLRLACNQERMDEYRNYCGVANTIGVPFRLIGVDEIMELWPLAARDGLVGALFHPDDGHTAPADVTMAFAKAARTGGVDISQQTAVEAIEKKENGEWLVRTSKGEITCEIIISATGNYARQTAAMVGLDIPVIPCEHQYIVTDNVPELIERKEKGLKEMPVLRESDASYYLREERQGYILGPYEKGTKCCFENGVPDSFGRDLLPGDLDRLMPHVEAAIARVPSFANAGIKDIINGPISYTPDGNPLLGPVAGIDNFYLAEGFSFGITAAGGAGKVLAELILEGEASIDMLSMDPRRFGAYANKDYTMKKNVEAYEHVFVIHYPMEERPAARPAKTIPCHDRLEARGAVWGQRYGWERANWFAPEGVERKDVYSFRRSNWFEHVGNECLAMRDRVGLLDLSPFSKFEVRGAGTAEWLETLVANNVPKKIGSLSLGHNLFPSGGVRSEFTITKMGEQHFYLVSAGAAERYDYDFLMKSLPKDGSVQLQNITTSRGTFVLAGPKSRELLAKLTEADLSNKAFRWLSAQTIDIGLASDVRALRVNFVGELGWELHHPIEYQNYLFDIIMEAGEDFDISLIGMRAMESMRIEKSYRMWGLELTKDYSPLESGINRFVNLNKTGYVGRDKLIEQQQKSPPTAFVTLEVEVDDADCLGNEPIYQAEEMIGRVTSGAYGHRTGKSLALGFVSTEKAVEGSPCEVVILGNRFKAVMISESPYDSNNAKLRA